MALLTPPDAFGIVGDGIYRSDILRPAHFGFMKTLNLKTVIVLTPEVPARGVMSFLDENGIKLVHLGFQAWKPKVTWRPVSDELIKEGLELTLNRENHPILVQCTSGIHETGTFVGCLRKLQGWSFSSIVGEYRSYAGTKARYVNEQYIELFDVDLITLPKSLPVWFESSLMMLNEEETEYDRLQRQKEGAIDGSIIASVGIGTTVSKAENKQTAVEGKRPTDAI